MQDLKHMSETQTGDWSWASAIPGGYSSTQGVAQVLRKMTWVQENSQQRKEEDQGVYEEEDPHRHR